MILMAASAGADQISNDAFAITLPAGFGEFTKQAQTTDGKEGKIETTNWISKSPTGEAVVVTMSKMSGKILAPEKIINGTRDALLKSLHATIDSEEKLTGDLPGTGLTFHNKSAFLRSRLAVKGDRLYQVLYVGRTAEQRVLPVVGEMFQSFQISAPPAVAQTSSAH
jgi:hypothetical protein